VAVGTEHVPDLDEQHVPLWATGLADIDGTTGGGWAGAVWLVTGPEGAGKTTLALGFAREAAIRQGRAVRWLSTSHAPDQLVQQALAAEVGYLGLLDPATLTDAQQAALAERSRAVKDAPLVFESVPPDSAGAALAKKQSNTALLVIDDLTDPGPALLVALKAQAEQTGVWVLVVAGGPGLDRRAARKALAYEVDVALHIDRPELDDPTTDRIGEADLAVLLPCRRTVEVVVAHQPQYARLVNIAPAVL
jgi:replicative DNA helicase